MNKRLVPPKAARKKLLDLLHSTHSHSAMEWATIREIWWWNGIKNELEFRNRACSSCAIDKRAKNPDKPVLPVDLLEYSPGEYMTSNIFEIEKKIFITVTDRLSGLILGDRLKDKSAAETTKALESIFVKLGPPGHMRTDNGTNYLSEKFAKLMDKYGIHHTSCSPEYHQGNGAAEKAVDTLKKMLRKTGKNSDIRELAYKLNCRIRMEPDVLPWSPSSAGG